MFNFSGEGNVGITARANSSGYTAPELRGGHGIEYWYHYTQTLIKSVHGLSEERDENARIAAERKAVDAGLRAVIRACLQEIRKVNPNHPLLDKKVRDQIFTAFQQQELGKILKDGGVKEMWPTELLTQNTVE